MIRRLALVLVLGGASLVWATTAGAGPGMGWGQWTSPDLTYGQCIERAGPALRDEGFTTVERHGRFFFGTSTGPASVSVSCYSLARGAVVTIVVGSIVRPNGSHDSRAVVGRLHDRIFGAPQPQPQPQPGRDGWALDPREHRGKDGQRFSYACGARPAVTGRLWGTDLYTDDSTVCAAAVHAGVVTLQRGGNVTIEIRAGAASYAGSTRNGVTSAGYGGWAGSYVFVR